MMIKLYLTHRVFHCQKVGIKMKYCVKFQLDKHTSTSSNLKNC